jgi:hypothetical protein
LAARNPVALVGPTRVPGGTSSLDLAARFSGEVVALGGVGFVQTAGELLGWHPHLHVLLTDGGCLPDSTFRHLLSFDSIQGSTSLAVPLCPKSSPERCCGSSNTTKAQRRV